MERRKGWEKRRNEKRMTWERKAATRCFKIRVFHMKPIFTNKKMGAHSPCKNIAKFHLVNNFPDSQVFYHSKEFLNKTLSLH